MKINSNSWHYRIWSDSFRPFSEPESTDLCRYCHKVFWALFWKIAMICMAVMCFGALLFILGALVIAHPFNSLLFVLALASAITVIVLYIKWMNRVPSYENNETVNPVSAWLNARKTKVCPLITFKSED